MATEEQKLNQLLEKLASCRKAAMSNAGAKKTTLNAVGRLEHNREEWTNTLRVENHAMDLLIGQAMSCGLFERKELCTHRAIGELVGMEGIEKVEAAYRAYLETGITVLHPFAEAIDAKNAPTAKVAQPSLGDRYFKATMLLVRSKNKDAKKVSAEGSQLLTQWDEKNPDPAVVAAIEAWLTKVDHLDE